MEVSINVLMLNHRRVTHFVSTLSLSMDAILAYVSFQVQLFTALCKTIFSANDIIIILKIIHL